MSMMDGMAGADDFKQWIKDRGFKTYTKAAEYLGLDKSIVTKIANGSRCPGRSSALRLQAKTGIPVSAWESEHADEMVSVARTNRRNSSKDK